MARCPTRDYGPNKTLHSRWKRWSDTVHGSETHGAALLKWRPLIEHYFAKAKKFQRHRDALRQDKLQLCDKLEPRRSHHHITMIVQQSLVCSLLTRAQVAGRVLPVRPVQLRRASGTHPHVLLYQAQRLQRSSVFATLVFQHRHGLLVATEIRAPVVLLGHRSPGRMLDYRTQLVLPPGDLVAAQFLRTKDAAPCAPDDVMTWFLAKLARPSASRPSFQVLRQRRRLIHRLRDTLRNARIL